MWSIHQKANQKYHVCYVNFIHFCLDTLAGAQRLLFKIDGVFVCVCFFVCCVFVFVLQNALLFVTFFAFEMANIDSFDSNFYFFFVTLYFFRWYCCVCSTIMAKSDQFITRDLVCLIVVHNIGLNIQLGAHFVDDLNANEFKVNIDARIINDSTIHMKTAQQNETYTHTYKITIIDCHLFCSILFCSLSISWQNAICFQLRRLAHDDRCQFSYSGFGSLFSSLLVSVLFFICTGSPFSLEYYELLNESIISSMQSNLFISLSLCLFRSVCLFRFCSRSVCF